MCAHGYTWHSVREGVRYCMIYNMCLWTHLAQCTCVWGQRTTLYS